MATQVTHAALTERVFDKYFYKFNKQDFFIGTLFPDIRYLAGINRGLTHFDKIGFNEILEEKNAFLAGMLYHSFVDVTRQQWLTGNGVYELVPYDYHWSQAMKFFEDRFYYQDVKNWEVVTGYFKKIVPQELQFNIPEQVIREWHDMLIKYLSLDSSKVKFLDSSKTIGIPEDIAVDINLHIEVLENNKQVVKLCKQFHDEYEVIVSNLI